MTVFTAVSAVRDRGADAVAEAVRVHGLEHGLAPTDDPLATVVSTVDMYEEQLWRHVLCDRFDRDDPWVVVDLWRRLGIEYPEPGDPPDVAIDYPRRIGDVLPYERTDF